jgi:hypothetical protein
MLTGKWTYRSYRNSPDLIGENPRAALALILEEGVLDLELSDDSQVRGGLGMQTGLALRLNGNLLPGDPAAFFIIGLGIDGTPTEGWRYDYRGVVGYRWPRGIAQVQSLLGTVVRVNAHGPTAPAGVTASFIAVRQIGDAPPRTARQSPLMKGL